MSDHTTNESANEIAYGYCHCGCGRKTRIAAWNDKRYGSKKGEPRRYISGHDKRRSPKERFWEKVDKQGENDCWNWIASTSTSDYGHFRCNDIVILAHRYSWILHNGEIPDGMFVCHTCDNRKCVNPAHLWLGTNNDNMQDMKRKGRGRTALRFGENSTNVKLTELQVREIIQLRADGVTQQAIADQFGISQSNVSFIVLRKRWKRL